MAGGRTWRVSLPRWLRECPAHAFPRDYEILRQHARFRGDRYEIGVADPAGQRMQVEVSRNAGAGRFAEVEAEVEAVGMVERGEGTFGASSEVHHFSGGWSGQSRERCLVFVGHHHDVSGGVGIAVEADVVVLGAEHDEGGAFGVGAVHAVGDGIVGSGDHVAEDTACVARVSVQLFRNARARFLVRLGDVGVAPWGPEVIHGISVKAAVGRSAIKRSAVELSAMRRSAKSKRPAGCRLAVWIPEKLFNCRNLGG